MTHAALLTPRGRGGLAVLLVAGRESESVLDRVVAAKTTIARLEVGRTALGKVRDADGAIVDEVLVARAGPDRFELGCHGGPAVVRRVLAVLAAAGAEERPALDLLPPADATVLEARERLPLATTDLAAKLLLAQHEGALAREIARLRTVVERRADPSADLARLERTARLGIACWNPPRVALVGRPNAGKSTLFNALLGRERAITSPEPGTTRDALEEPISLEGVPAVITDLAGLRDATDEVERAGVARASDRAREADVRVLVIDASLAIDGHVEELLRRHSDGAIVALNKRDVLTPELRSYARTKLARALPDGVRPIEVSARTRDGLGALRQALVERITGLRTDELERVAQGPALFTERQRALVASGRWTEITDMGGSR